MTRLQEDVADALAMSGVEADVQVVDPNTVALTRNGDPAVILSEAGATYDVFVVHPRGEFELHGQYRGPDSFEVAVSEAIEHLTRSRMLGGHHAIQHHHTPNSEWSTNEEVLKSLLPGDMVVVEAKGLKRPRDLVVTGKDLLPSGTLAVYTTSKHARRSPWGTPAGGVIEKRPGEPIVYQPTMRQEPVRVWRLTRVKAMEANATRADMIAKRTTADGKSVILWDDGQLTYAAGYAIPGVGKPRNVEQAMEVGWLVLGDVELYDAAEVPELYKAARKAVKQGGHGKPGRMRELAGGASGSRAPRVQWDVVSADARGRPTERHWRAHQDIVVVDDPGRAGGRYGIHYVERGGPSLYATGRGGYEYLAPSGVRFSRLEDVHRFVAEHEAMNPNGAFPASRVVIVNNTGHDVGPMVMAEVSRAVRRNERLPEELADLFVLRIIEVDGQRRGILDWA